MNLIAKTMTDSMHYCYCFFSCFYLACETTETRHGHVTRAGGSLGKVL